LRDLRGASMNLLHATTRKRILASHDKNYPAVCRATPFCFEDLVEKESSR